MFRGQAWPVDASKSFRNWYVVDGRHDSSASRACFTDMCAPWLRRPRRLTEAGPVLVTG